MRKLADWLECYTVAESLDLLRDFALSHALEGGSVGRRIAGLIRACDFKALCEFELDYNDPQWTVGQLVHCRQALAFFTKLEHLDIGVDKVKTAWSKFEASESLCRETNELFEAWSSGRCSLLPGVDAVLFAAQRKIAHVLGPVPSLQKLRYRFGPGATTLTKKREASSRRKLYDGIACSEDLALGAHQLLSEMPAWADLHGGPSALAESGGDLDGEIPAVRLDLPPLIPQLADVLASMSDGSHPFGIRFLDKGDVATAASEADGLSAREDPEDLTTPPGRTSVPVQIMDGVLGFVAKNAKTYRGIVTEPPLNGVYQLALGDYIAKRLAKFGVDLTDQSLNRRLAKEGSLTGALATLDLSSASDTVAIELVHHLLPVDWALALSAGRSSSVVYKGNRIYLEKFSSMGNGYTFALESLIFWALARSCCEANETVSVYGDDIIAPTHRVGLLTKILTSCGFILNKEKSYSSGPFRESCGADYYRGIDIRPFYQQDWISPADLFKLHNFYVRHLDPARAEMVLGHIHPSLRIFGPDGYGDGHLLSEDFPRKRKDRHRRLGYSGYVFDTFKHGTNREKSRPIPGDYVYALYSIYQRSAEDLVQGVVGDSLPPHDFAKAYRAIQHLRRGKIIGDPIPEVKLENGDYVKAASLPGIDGYKRISIYTLGG